MNTKLTVDLMAVKVMRIESQHKEGTSMLSGEQDGFNYLCVWVSAVPEIYSNLKVQKILIDTITGHFIKRVML